MKATILGSLALVILATVLFAAPALSNPNSQQVTIKSLARQVRALRAQVNSLQGQVAAAQSTANTAQTTATKLDGCLSHALGVTRYGDYVGSSAAAMFTDYDPDVLGYVPNIIAGTFRFQTGLDVTNAGSPSYYLAIVEPSCAGGFHMAEAKPAQQR